MKQVSEMKIDDFLTSPTVSWLTGEGNEIDVVLSSRVRLARNFEDLNFPSRADREDRLLVLKRISDAQKKLEKETKSKYSFFRMEELSLEDRWILVEKHLMSSSMTEGELGQGLLIRNDSKISVLINEEDHVRIQGMARGLNLDEAYDLASRTDEILAKKSAWAYQEKLGYLTACPTNVGTGMRASVMLHLPALCLKKKMNQLRAAIQPHGMILRGLDGEGSEANGYIFQFSNQVTLGISEEELLDKLSTLTKQIVELERKTREEIDLDQLANQSGRAYGILKYAHEISSEEALELASWVRLGRYRNTLPVGKADWFENLLVAIRPFFLQKIQGRNNLNPKERDQGRAKWIREWIDGFTY